VRAVSKMRPKPPMHMMDIAKCRVIGALNLFGVSNDLMSKESGIRKYLYRVLAFEEIKAVKTQISFSLLRESKTGAQPAIKKVQSTENK
jgi:hypothetical protein